VRKKVKKKQQIILTKGDNTIKGRKTMGDKHGG